MYTRPVLEIVWIGRIILDPKKFRSYLDKKGHFLDMYGYKELRMFDVKYLFCIIFGMKKH